MYCVTVKSAYWTCNCNVPGRANTKSFVYIQNIYVSPRIYSRWNSDRVYRRTINSASQTFTRYVRLHPRPNWMLSTGTTITKIVSNVTTPKYCRSVTVVKYCRYEAKNISFSLSARKYRWNNTAVYDSKMHYLGWSQVSANSPKFRRMSQVYEWWNAALAKLVLSIQLYIIYTHTHTHTPRLFVSLSACVCFTIFLLMY